MSDMQHQMFDITHSVDLNSPSDPLLRDHLERERRVITMMSIALMLSTISSAVQQSIKHHEQQYRNDNFVDQRHRFEAAWLSSLTH